MKRLAVSLAAMAISAAAMGQVADWYPMTATSTPAAGEIGMQDWLDKPAGKAGRITRVGEQLIYDGKPIRLWGLNLCFGNCVPETAMADKRAAFYAKYGINAVRFHKFTESDYQTGDSVTIISPAAVDRMDYQIAQFKKAGIYSTLSVHFGNAMLGAADRADVPYLDELDAKKELDPKKPASRLHTEHSTLFYSPEVQQVHIKQMLNLLKHKNPYTGATYAEEPAIAFIECVNEQSILFHSSMAPLKAYPTIRKMTGQRFSKWLKDKYGSQEALTKAWGQEAFDSFKREGFDAPGGESLANENILPLGNPWFWDSANLNTSQTFRRQRLLDSLEFLYQLQVECYQRYATALRDAGYKGELLGSNWQAGSAYSHFANLNSDATMGTIDRHNYFGGGGGRRGGGAFGNGSMLQTAGSGLLSTGMQQVADRPFMMSEWIHVFPNEWGVEGPAILGAYGMGLQGWDASFMFQNGDSGTFSSTVGRDTWDVTAPQVLGIFPAVTRQIYRGDVKESDVQAFQHVNMASLFAGKLGVQSTVKQGYDQKEITTSKVPSKALAVARTAVSYDDSYKETPEFDLTKYTQDGVLISSTQQLRWKEGKSKTDGLFTMNTPGTKAVVGFAADQKFELGEVSIAPASRYAAIYVTAQQKDQTLADAKKILVVAMARARNTAMAFGPNEDTLTAKGKAPILLEGVKATISLKKEGTPRVIVLDQDGARTAKTLPADNGSVTIDTARDQTPYYLIEYP